MTSRRAATLFGALLALAALPARAASTCSPAPVIGATDGRIGEIDPERRLAWIDEELARGARQVHDWKWGWGVALGVGTVANLVPLAYVPPRRRIDWYTGAVTTVVGIIPLVLAPLDGSPESREQEIGVAARARPDTCALLAEAETRLVRDAQLQAAGQRWWVHLGNVLVNAGVGAFLIVGFRHWRAGIFNAAVGASVGEAIILTQPTGAIHDLEHYRAGAL
jgi:hypothetical protein